MDRGAVEEDPEKEMKNNERVSVPGSISQYYSMRLKCRRILATSKNVLEHESGTGMMRFRGRQRRRGNDGGATKTSSSSCSSIFVSPITWMMLDQTEENDAGYFPRNHRKIHCPKCRSKIGAFAWSGERRKSSVGRLSRRLFTYRKQSSTRLRYSVQARTANRKEKSVLFWCTTICRSLAHEVKLVIATM